MIEEGTMLCNVRERSTRLALAVVVAAAASWIATATVAARDQAGDISVRGCVERDAAASTPIFKLVTPAPVKIYRLSAPKEIDIAAHVGHTVDIVGTVSTDPPGRSSSRESELVVKKLTMVNNSCSSEVPAFRRSGVPANFATSELRNFGTPRVTQS
jgi:hypothetical protein